MAEKNDKGNNVLPFKRVAKPDFTFPTAARELQELLTIYDHLIALLRETYGEGLDELADSIVASVVRCRQALASGIDEQAGQKMLKEMREGLRQIPGTLRSLLPGLGPRLGESMERKLGIQFSRY